MKCDMIYVYILIKMWYIYELSRTRADTVKEMKYHIMYKGAPFGDTFGGAKKDLDQGQTVVP